MHTRHTVSETCMLCTHLSILLVILYTQAPFVARQPGPANAATHDRSSCSVLRRSLPWSCPAMQRHQDHEDGPLGAAAIASYA